MSIAERDLNLPDILMVPDIAHYLRISRSAAYELAHVPGFPALIMGRKIRTRRESFLSWLDKQEKALCTVSTPS
jgi:excisionase family DNA binding protein